MILILEHWWIWIAFNAFVISAIMIDLFIFHRNPKTISVKNAFATSAIWIGLALLFNVWIYFYRGKEVALNFLAGYLIEKSLSIDNLFVFLMLFTTFKTPLQYQHKVLFWGVLGAIIMRGMMIFLGLTLINAFHWMFYLFGAFLIFAGIKIAFHKDEPQIKENAFFLFLKKRMRVSPHYDGDRFFSKLPNGWYATPLFMLLLTVEGSDFVFALDSIPAVMAITRDPFIVYTSNIFAILGLRSLYFALSSFISFFHYLNYALSAILIFVGGKMILESFVDIPIGIVLGFICISLSIAIIVSIYFPPQSKK